MINQNAKQLEEKATLSGRQGHQLESHREPFLKLCIIWDLDEMKDQVQLEWIEKGQGSYGQGVGKKISVSRSTLSWIQSVLMKGSVMFFPVFVWISIIR